MPHWGKDGKMAYLMNADKYSTTTSQHQSACRGLATTLIPFSALQRIISTNSEALKRLNLIDVSADRYDFTGKYSSVSFGHRGTRSIYKRKVISEKEYSELSPEDQAKCYKIEERRPQATVLEYAGRYYLSSMDGSNYSISELPQRVHSVDEAFESLKPNEIKHPITGESIPYLRQGEWFFIDLSLDKKTAKQVYNTMSKDFTLPRDDTRSNSHIATRGMQTCIHTKELLPNLPINTLLVSGSVKHSIREHRTCKLSTLNDIRIFAAYHNTARVSYSAGGKVD
jgi:hypothetical protein